MSFFTALSLSFNNLLTKKGRTILTAFAGSIGIIGIALILAISTGVNNYIDDIQRDTLSSFPIQIEKESTDMTALMGSLMLGTDINENGEPVGDRDAVYANPIMYRMMSSLFNAEVNTNNLEKFKIYLDEHQDELNEYTTAIQYGYDVKLNVYATDPNGEYAKADFTDLMQSVIDGSQMINTMTSAMSNMGGVSIWQELLTDPETGEVSALVTEQYDLIYGKWPSAKNEIILVLTENNEISDITLYALGLVDRQTMVNSTMSALMGKEDTSFDDYIGKSWSYEDICKINLKLVMPTDYYQYDNSTKLWVDISDNQALLNSVINNGMDLKIVGIIKPNEDATSAFISGSLCYDPTLTNYYLETVNSSEIVKAQKSNADTNVLTGLPFVLEEIEDLTDGEKIKAFKDYAMSLTDTEKAHLYEEILATPNETFLQDAVNQLLDRYKDQTAEEIVTDIKNQYSTELGYSEELIDSMLTDYDKAELIELLDTTVREMIIAHYKESAKESIETIYGQPSEDELSQLKSMILGEMYASISSLPADQMAMAKKQIDIGFVAQSWSVSTGMSLEAASQYLMTLSDNEFATIFDTVLNASATKLYGEYSTMSSNADNAKKVANAFDKYLDNMSDSDLIYCYDHNMPDKVSDKTYDDVLKTLGVATTDDPKFIYLYPTDFEMKENIASMIDNYNDSVQEDDKIEYADIAAMLMSSVSDIITAISVVLICFVSISLVVSSIMIGIITYISVLERTKEIGILRAVGASKRDISRVFNAETMIVGLLAGLVGILSTVMLCIPISLIARNATGIQSLTAVLPWYGYLLIVLSVALTMIAGLFPSKMAAKKDPVIALRTE
jgi:putative ABC transport system permease protein